MGYRIVDAIPAKAGAGRRAKYDFSKIKHGQSMIFDKNDDGWYIDGNGSRSHRALAAAYQWGRKNGVKMHGASTTDGEFAIWPGDLVGE